MAFCNNKILKSTGALLSACFIYTFFACNKNDTLFTSLPASKTGIDFNNVVIENDSINPIDLEFLYNGGGIAVADFNNDGLSDLYFTASTVSNKLYLNKGNLSFKDITAEAKVDGKARWCNAASVVDINNDGLQDIYVCASIKKNPVDRANLLYVNQGVGKNGVPIFKEMANEYHLADTSLSVQGVFFDYDNDGDLDMYLLTTKLANRQSTEFTLNNNAADQPKDDFDKLFRNDYDPKLKHPVFTEVSAEAGVAHPGYGLGIAVADINRDGWKDLYINNDFFGSDVLYINNRNGTFSNKLNSMVKHTSTNAMGNDVIDINNDGLADIFSVDMNPEDNYRKKKNMSKNNYFVYQNMSRGIYMLQYVRNTLQLNQGPTLKENDSISEPIFSEIGFMAGVAQTDWSWTPSIADFDNDGFRDILITNGYPRDVTDHDFAAYRRNTNNTVPKSEVIDQIPKIKIPNYAYKNSKNLTFENKTKDWGLATPSFSAGAVYADLDNDGDLDYIISNINEVASVYQNNTKHQIANANNYFKIKFVGDNLNLNGLGAIATIHYGHQKQVYENSPYRGYLSTVDCKAFFGLGNVNKIDSVVVEWNNGKKQIIKNVKVNQTITVNVKDATDIINQKNIINNGALFTEVTTSKGINFRHFDNEFIDFNVQRLLPHKLSEYGPALASGDVDKNGLDDIVISGSGDMPTSILYQQTSGKFISKYLQLPLIKDVRRPETLGTLLFDVDNDGDLDLYLASGSNQFEPNTKNYEDWFYMNDGKGNFTFHQANLPKNFASKSCLKAFDYDKDGDLDLFIGGRVLPKSYPLPVSSFIYRNDSKNGQIKFTDVSKNVAPGLENLGLVCDAIWTDFDNDKQTDLIISGEWMSMQFFKNQNGKFVNVSETTGINNYKGWWNSLVGGDFDNDGDIDYVAGNLGKNSFYKASDEFPVGIYAKDFDNNSQLDIVPTVYLLAQDGERKEFPAQGRDDHIDQLPGLKDRYISYKEFGKATVHDIFTSKEMDGALHLQANYMKSCYIENLGNGKFSIKELPSEVQFAPIFGMLADDFNHDGNLDLALNGNDYSTEVGNGRYDALNGLVLIGNGAGKFKPLKLLKSGLFIPGNGKSLVKCKGIANQYLMVAAQNSGPLKVFKSNSTNKNIALTDKDLYVIYTLKNNKKRREEVYFGNSYLSQSSKFITINNTFKKVEVFDNKGKSRIVYQ